MKMSKSLGNTIAPEQVIKQYGADILRFGLLNRTILQIYELGLKF